MMMLADELQSLDASFVLAAGAICLWKVDLDCSDAEVVAATELLSHDEQQRAARFLKTSHQKKFIMARAGLRLILGRYLEMDPGEIEFITNPYGKPAVSNHSGKPDVRFNLAHSGNKTWYAVAVGQ